MTAGTARCHTAMVSTLADTGRSQGFVGRNRELETVRSVVDDARSGRMRALLVSGDAGVGKTRLLECATVAATSESGEVIVLRGACLPLSTMSVPLVPYGRRCGSLQATPRVRWRPH